MTQAEKPLAFVSDFTSVQDIITIGATTPTGFEAVALEEIKQKVRIVFTSMAAQGKVYFQTSSNCVSEIHQLKSVDNLFLVVKYIPGYRYAKRRERAIKDIQELPTTIDWDEVAEFWKLNQKFCEPRKPKVKAKKHDDQYDIYDAPLSPSVENNADTKPVVAGGNGDAVQKVSAEKNGDAESDQPAKKPRLESGDPPAAAESNNNDSTSVNNSGAAAAPNVETSNGAEDKRAGDSMESGEKLLSFRVSSNRVGKDQSITSPDGDLYFGGSLQDVTNWKVDLTKFDIEILLNLGTDSVMVALALTYQSLHRRNITNFGVTTLRATICYGLLRLLDVKSGEIIMDPMCGTGAISIESANEWKNCYNIAGDNAPAAVEKCAANVAEINKRFNHKIDILNWDTRRLPWRSESVDVFVTDLPFGKRMSTKFDNRLLYPAVLKEMGRVARTSARACLLTYDKKSMMAAMAVVAQIWKLKRQYMINVGGLKAGVFILNRTAVREVSKPAAAAAATPAATSSKPTTVSASTPAPESAESASPATTTANEAAGSDSTPAPTSTAPAESAPAACPSTTSSASAESSAPTESGPSASETLV